MRLLLITNDYPPKPGGIQQYLAGLVAALPGEVRVLGPAHEGAPDEPGVVRGHRRFLWPTRRTARWVRGHVDEFAPDAVLFGAPHPLARLGPALREATGVPYGVLGHGAEVTLPAAFPVTRQWVAGPLRRADVLFAVSEFTADRMRRLTKRPVTVVGAGVGEGFEPGDPPPTPVVGCVSRFVPRKGQRDVLRAVAALRAEGRDVEVLLVGKGRDENDLRRLARRLGVPARFEVGVPYAALPGLYRQMSVFAMPSRSRWLGLEAEGLGVVYLEAAASGLPVVAGGSGGAPETVDPGRTGFVVDDLGTLVDALRLLVDDPDRARAMGADGARRARRDHTWGAVARRFTDGLAAIIGG